MNMTLYQVNKELENLLEVGEVLVDVKTGEVVDKEYELALIEMLPTCMESFGQWKLKQDGFIDQIDTEIKRLNDMKNFLKNRRDRNVNFAVGVLIQRFNGKFESPTLRMSLRKSESVQVLDESALPKKFLAKKVEYKPDKNAIKEAIKSGQKVKGAAIVESQNLQIK